MLDLGKQFFNRDCVTKAFTYLSYRDYSEAELKKKLKPMFCDVDIYECLNYLREHDLISDVRLANLLVKHYFITKKLGEVRVRKEILKRGITKEVLDEAIQEFYYENEFDVKRQIREYILKYYNRSELCNVMLMRKIYLRLKGRGFTYQVVRSVIDELRIDPDDNNPDLPPLRAF
jgi:SOS response regulatory protein OraA/RecX